MLGFGANLMLWNHFGVGGDVKVQPAKENYLTFQQQPRDSSGTSCNRESPFTISTASTSRFPRKRLCCS